MRPFLSVVASVTPDKYIVHNKEGSGGGKVSKPVIGMVLGLLLGFLIGVFAIEYFSIEKPLDRVCIIASVMMFLQLLGATIGGTIGKA